MEVFEIALRLLLYASLLDLFPAVDLRKGPVHVRLVDLAESRRRVKTVDEVPKDEGDGEAFTFAKSREDRE
jgi:hypothetical protein